MSTEKEFRKYESALKKGLSDCEQRLRADGIEIRDQSNPQYHYKNETLDWCYSFQKELKINYESIYIKIVLKTNEIDVLNQMLNIQVNGGVYSQGGPNRVSLSRSSEENIESVLKIGLYNYLTNIFNENQAEIKESM